MAETTSFVKTKQSNATTTFKKTQKDSTSPPPSTMTFKTKNQAQSSSTTAAAATTTTFKKTQKDSPSPPPSTMTFKTKNQAQSSSSSSTTTTFKKSMTVGNQQQTSSSSSSSSYKQEGIQFLVLMDCTGSMGPYLDAAVRSCVTLIDQLSRTMKPCNIGFVGYRDHGDRKRFEIADFCDDVHQVTNFMKGIKASGGDDEPEDVLGGLEKALSQEWDMALKHRIIFHVADAGGHGSLCPSGARDRYPDGHEDDADMGEIAAFMKDSNIEYFFAKIKDRSDEMIEQFRHVGIAGKESVILTDHPSKLLSSMVESVSISKTRGTRK